MHRTLVLLLALLLALPAAAAAKPNKKVCGDTATGYAHCNSRVVTDAKGNPAATADAARLRPGRPAGRLRLHRPTGGAGTDDRDRRRLRRPERRRPTSRTYRAQYGLPPCTTANGCFRKVNQSGGTTPPARQRRLGAGDLARPRHGLGRSARTARSCSSRRTRNRFTDLAAAVDTAARARRHGDLELLRRLGVLAGDERRPTTATSTTRASRSRCPRATAGYGVEFPAASQYVTAVGGTSLSEVRLDVQRARLVGRRQRLLGVRRQADVADTTPAAHGAPSPTCPRSPTRTPASRSTTPTATRARAGWMVFGGTSVSAPIIAGVYALGGGTCAGVDPYDARGALHDVTSGSNGSCSVAYLCTAGPGFDGPTGLGTPERRRAPSRRPPSARRARGRTRPRARCR